MAGILKEPFDKSTGPKAAKGWARIGAAHWLYGLETNDRRQERD